MKERYGKIIQDIREGRADIMCEEAVLMFKKEMVINFLIESFPKEDPLADDTFVSIIDTDRPKRMLKQVLSQTYVGNRSEPFSTIQKLIESFGENVIDVSFYSPDYPPGSVPIGHASRAYHNSSSSQEQFASDSIIGLEHGAVFIIDLYSPLSLARFSKNFEASACAFYCEVSHPDIQWVVNDHEFRFPEIARCHTHFTTSDYARLFWYCLTRIVLESSLLDDATYSKRIGYFVLSLIDPHHIIQTGIFGQEFGLALQHEAFHFYQSFCDKRHVSDNSGCCLQ
jgi:hypothetical protein